MVKVLHLRPTNTNVCGHKWRVGEFIDQFLTFSPIIPPTPRPPGEVIATARRAAQLCRVRDKRFVATVACDFIDICEMESSSEALNHSTFSG